MPTFANYTGDNVLHTFRQRISQINVDAFTTGHYEYNRGRLTPDRGFLYLCEIMHTGGNAFLAFDDGVFASHEFPIAFLMSREFKQDPFVGLTDLPNRVPVESTTYLAELAVDVGHRGRGKGTRLVEFYLNWARSTGYSHCAVRTNESDQPARDFYTRKCNFQETDVVIHTQGYGTKRYFTKKLY